MAQAVGGNAELVAGDADFAALVVEVGLALIQAFALDGQGSLAILLGVEFCPFKDISLPLAHGRVLVKVHVAGQAAFGAVDDAQEGAAVCRLRVDLEGFPHHSGFNNYSNVFPRCDVDIPPRVRLWQGPMGMRIAIPNPAACTVE